MEPSPWKKPSRSETTLEVVEGMQFDKGYLSPYFVTNAEAMECRLENVTSSTTKRRSAASKTCCRSSKKSPKVGKPLLIIAEDVEGEALATLVVNKLRGTLTVCAVKAPGFGDRRKAMCEDIAILTGGKFISEDLGIKLESLNLEDLAASRAWWWTKKTPPWLKATGRALKFRDGSIRSAARSKRPLPITNREKLQERPGQARRWRGRHQCRRCDRDRNEGTEKPASKTRCTRTRAAVERASSPVVAWHCCGASLPWKRSSLRTTTTNRIDIR